MSWSRRLFVQKTARSVAEIQPNLDTTADVVVFLEVLGFTEGEVAAHGFRDLHEFAGEVYEVADRYADGGARSAQESALLTPVPSVGRRLGQGLSLTFPWVSSLFVLLIFGVSLWLAFGLPGSVTTALVVGIFLGVVASEGPMQLFQRLFVFHYDQSNMPELRRIVKRSYSWATVVAVSLLALLCGAGILLKVPFGLVELSAAVALAVLLHRVSYVVVYSLKKYAQLVFSYAAALFSLVAVFFICYDLIPQTVPRYLTALSTAFVVLMIAPAYYTYKVGSSRSVASFEDKKRHRLNPIVVNAKTIPSNFHIQLREEAPYYLLGSLFFALMFGDRVLSWYFNPVHLANGVQLPLAFNSAYHLGADLALAVVFPAAVATYVVMGALPEQLSNLGVTTDLAGIRKVDQFFRDRYTMLLAASVGPAAAVAAALVQFMPQIMAQLGAPPQSGNVLVVAAVSNVLMAFFMANSLLLVFMDRAKSLVAVSALSVGILAGAGYFLGQTGFQNVIYAYLLAAAVAACLTAAMARDVLRDPASRFFSRFV